MCVHVFPLKPAPFCKLAAGRGSTNKSATSPLRLSLCPLHNVSPPSFPLSQALLHIRYQLFSLSSCTIRLRWIPEHSFLLENDAAHKRTRWDALLLPSAIPCNLSPLISRIHSCFFLDWRRTVSSKLFDTQIPRFPLKSWCLFITFAVYSLAFAATNTAFC